MSSATSNGTTGTNTVDAAGDTALLRQTLLTADEVYIYKLPPLTSATRGHRAEDWNLASPLATTRLLVERRGDALVLEFYKTSSTVLFCSATLADPTQHHRWLEPVVDSSRYFTLQITRGTRQTATIGFGFRERDTATDLREAVQQCAASVRRADTALTHYKVPQLAAGEKIRVAVPGGSGSSKKVPNSGSSGGVPLLLKKPPPSADVVSATSSPAAAEMEQVTLDMKGVNLEEDHDRRERRRNQSSDAMATDEDDDEQKGDDTSGGAVYEGGDDDDDDDWESDFQSAT